MSSNFAKITGSAAVVAFVGWAIKEAIVGGVSNAQTALITFAGAEAAIGSLLFGAAAALLYSVTDWSWLRHRG